MIINAQLSLRQVQHFHSTALKTQYFQVLNIINNVTICLRPHHVIKQLHFLSSLSLV